MPSRDLAAWEYIVPGEHLNVSPMVSLVDTPLRISVEKIPIQHPVTLRLTSYVDNQFCLESHATFISDESGVVDLSKHAPCFVGYDGVDPMGLFWTQRRTQLEEVPHSNLVPKNPVATHPLQHKHFLLTAEIEDRLVDFVQIERRLLSDTVMRVPIREQGLVATLFQHRDGKPRPGVIFLGGSEGGLIESRAALLANHGFTTLSLAYFGIEHLPAELVRIPLEYIKTGIDWFKQQSCVYSDSGIGVHGISRGGELALLTASTYPDITAVVSVCGSGLVMGGFHRTRDFQFPAWTYRGKPLHNVHEGQSTYVSMTDWEKFREYCGKRLDPSTISVERIKGAVLLFSGGKDQIWDSVKLAKISLERLRQYQFEFPHEHIIYPNAGHALVSPYVPIDSQRYGGSPKANAEACIDCWERTISFFKSHLF